MAYVSTEKASKLLGLSSSTLRRYANNNQIKFIRSAGGHRLYEVDDFLQRNSELETILYCRVSSSKQKDDLQRQIQDLRNIYPNSEVIKDIGSGLNFKRKGLQTLLERVMQGHKFRVVVSYRDRLARFGVDLIEHLIKQNGGELVVLNRPMEQSIESEVTEDLLAILHHFSCRMHGRRSHQNSKGDKSKKDKSVPEQSAKDDIIELVRSIPSDLQYDCGLSEFTEGVEN